MLARGTLRNRYDRRQNFATRKPIGGTVPAIMSQALFSWIQVSDLHFGHGDAEYGWDQKLVLEQLKQDLPKLRDIGAPHPDAIFVTGDIAFSGAGRSADEYVLAKEWFDSVAKATNLEPKDIYLVPGNHDVNRAKDSGRVFRSLLADLRAQQDTREGRIDTALSNEGDKKLLAERMQSYLEFATKFGPFCDEQTLPPAHERLYWRKIIEARQGLRVRVVGLNTALVSADEKDEGKLQLGLAQVHAAVGETVGKDELVVILTHHPLRPWLFDGKKAEQALQSKAHVHIFGHVHEADLQSVRHGSSKTFIRMIAGAAHAEREAQGVPARHGYNVAAVMRREDGSLELRIWPRRWAEKKYEFRADMDLLEDGETSIAHPLPTVLSTPEPTPMMTNMTIPGNSEWLMGRFSAIWSGRNVFNSQLIFDISGSAGKVNLVLNKAQKYYVGRTTLRADEKTKNDGVLPSQRVSRDAALIELIEGRWWIEKTSKTSKLLVNTTIVDYGERHPLVHGTLVVVGDVVGEFRDSRYSELVAMSAVDPQTGLLSGDGIKCEVGLALSKNRTPLLLALHFGSDNVKAACSAARILHETLPLAPVGRIDSTVAILIENGSRVVDYLKLVRTLDGSSGLVAGYWKIEGQSTEAGARVDAAIGGLARIATADGFDKDAPIDLARYALQEASIEEVAEFARKERLTGGGMGLLLLDEFDHHGELGPAARTALELELREFVGGLLLANDRISRAGHGALALATHQPLTETLRKIVSGWRDKGPVLMGKVELPRSLRVLELDDSAARQLAANAAAFVNEMGKGPDAPGLPAPIAYWLDAAHVATSKLERGSALVKTVEATWRLLGCILVSAFWSMRKKKPLPRSSTETPWSHWSDVTIGAADALQSENDRVGELAKAVVYAWQSEKGALRLATKHAATLSKLLVARTDPEALNRETVSLELALHEVSAALRSLRSWSLAAVREARATDALGNVKHIHYIDFTGPHLTGISRRRTVMDINIAEFVYWVRWAEGVAIPLVPLIRYEKLPDSNVEALLFVENVPTEPGFYEYSNMLGNDKSKLEVHERQLAR